MAYWLIQHNLESFDDRPDAIGMLEVSAKKDKNFRSISKGDKIVYHVRRNRSIGLFEVTSDSWLSYRRWSKKRPSPHLAYTIRPIYPQVCNLKLSDFEVTTQGRTAVSLTLEKYMKIKDHILGMGEPTDHESTVALFAKMHAAMGFPHLVKIRQEYPDVIAMDSTGKETRIELEFQSHTFENEHGGQPDLCDIVVCWEDTWGRAAKKPVLSMKKALY